MARILIVDDARFMREILSGILTGDGHEIAGEAMDGSEVLDVYKRCKPDIVTMDVNMPTKSGIEAIKELLSEDPNTKIVIVSSSGEDQGVKDAIEAGARGFITKPFNPDKVRAEVSRILERE